MNGRRRFLAQLAGLGTSALLPEALLQGQTAKHPAARAWVDFHHHFAPPAYTQALIDKNVLPAPLKGWSIQKTLDDMEQAGIATAMHSTVVPGVWFGDPNEARRLARDSNEYAAKIVSDYPKRFGSFATLTIPDIDGSLKEIEYALDTLKADGFQLLTSYGDKWLGDPFFEPIFEELNRRKALVFVHPYVNACCQNLLPGVSSASIEYGTDTTRAIARMVTSGASKQYPDVRMIFSHAGGTMPFLIGRFVERAPATPGARANPPVDFQAEVEKFYYDTAQSFSPAPMSALRRVVPISQILFGTDFPYRSSADSTTGLVDSKIFNARELQAIQHENAATLVPRLKS
jgi:predicted TIM-barrel fold metal-dependent hydrolase